MDYSLDTSALLDGWVRYYPRDVFPKFWTGIEGLIARRKMAAVDEVLRELEKKDDDVHGWAKRQSRLFVPLDAEIQGAMKTGSAASPHSWTRSEAAQRRIPS